MLAKPRTAIFPVFGWTYLSREALRDAEAQLQSSGEGMRDEIGFLLIHSRFADHFFPGTSVLQTRLRYVLFVPWMYRALQERRKELRGRGAAELETRLAARLRDWAHKNGQSGVIGERNTKRMMISRPSAAYWQALKTWKLIEPGNRGRLAWERSLEKVRRKGDPELEEEDDEDLVGLVDADFPPAPPEFLEEDREIGFVLGPQERDYLRGKLRQLKSPEGTLSLLAKLVDADTSLFDSGECFSDPVIKMAGEDAGRLKRAAGASALCGVGRGVYAALVEQLREQDKIFDTTYRDDLIRASAKLAPRALTLDVDAMESDLKMEIGPHLHRVLLETQAWLRDGTQDVTVLMDAYRDAEWNKKKRRSCLQENFTGRERRGEWRLDPALGGSRAAVPLHYRWGKVQQLLKDLAG